MKKYTLVWAMVFASALSLTSCGWETYLEEETKQAIETSERSWLSTAVSFQTTTAIEGLETAMKTIDPADLPTIIEKIKWEGTTISNIVSLAEWEGTPDVAAKFKEIDTRLKTLTSNPEISPADFVTWVEDVIASLKDLLK